MRLPRIPVLPAAGLLALALTVAWAPAAAQDDDEVRGLAGTVWVGPDGEYVTTMRFERGGVLAYAYDNRSYRNGKWKQTGKKLYFEMNDKYRECEATIDGDTIRGRSWNKTDKKWTTTLYRYQKPPVADE
jgi:hypothetical protein